MKCLGRNLDDHCCYIDGKVCKWLREDLEPGYRWSCYLRYKHGSWEKALKDPFYYNGPGRKFKKFGYNCKTFPGPNGCAQCGAGK